MNALRLRFATPFCVTLAFAAFTAAADDSPFLSLKDGLSSESALLRPGKIDFLDKHRAHETYQENLYNLFAFTPVFKGGGHRSK